MKIIHLLLACLLCLLGIIIFLWTTDVPADISGTLHPEYKTLLKSGTSVADLPAVKYVAYLFGLMMIFVFVSLIFMGARKNGRLGVIKWWLAAGLVGYVLVYTLFMQSYWSYAATGEAAYFLGFPAPTAWMLYGMWLFPLWFVAIFALKFDDWVLSPEEITVFKQQVAEQA